MTFRTGRSTYNDERYFGFHNCLCSNRSSRHQPLFVCFLTQFRNTFLNDSRLALIHQTHLVLIYINTDHFVTQLCQTCRTYATYVAEAKNTYVHNSIKNNFMNCLFYKLLITKASLFFLVYCICDSSIKRKSTSIFSFPIFWSIFFKISSLSFSEKLLSGTTFKNIFPTSF